MEALEGDFLILRLRQARREAPDPIRQVIHVGAPIFTQSSPIKHTPPSDSAGIVRSASFDSTPVLVPACCVWACCCSACCCWACSCWACSACLGCSGCCSALPSFACSARFHCLLLAVGLFLLLSVCFGSGSFVSFPSSLASVGCCAASFAAVRHPAGASPLPP